MIAVDTLLELDDIPDSERTLAAAAVRVGLRTLAQYLDYLVPAATFCAAFVTVAQGARSRELVALKAGGVNPLLAFAPLPLLALAIGVALGFVHETAGVRAAAVLSEQEGVVYGEITRSGYIWYHTGRVVYSARETDAGGDRVTDIHVLERDEQGRLLRQIQAERAVRLSPQQWSFEEAAVRSFDPSQPTRPPHFERAAEVTLELATDRTLRLAPGQLAALSLPVLADYVRSVLEAGGLPGPARFAFHQRATLPVISLLFALLAIPLGLAIEGSSGVALRALQGVLWIAGFLFLRDAVGGLARAGGVAALWLTWGLVASFFAVAGLRLARSPR